MTFETVTLKLPQRLLNDAGSVAAAQDVTIGHLVRQLLAKEVNRRLNPKTSNRADEGLVAAIQALLARDLAEADGWDNLAERLCQHGYELRPAGGGLALFKTSCGTRVCKASELGFAYRTLVARFGTSMPGHPHQLPEIEVKAPPAAPVLNSTVKGRLQRALEPVFKTSIDWETLTARLHKHGYVLRPQGTGCAIYAVETGRHVCNTATVGYRYRALVKKMGGPMPGHAHGADWVKTSEPELDGDFEVIERGFPRTVI